MSITIPISSRAEDALKERAAAQGKDLAQYASELLEQALDRTPAENTRTEPSDFGEWSARSQAFVSKMSEYAQRLSAGHVLDDSRESIYAGRGE